MILFTWKLKTTLSAEHILNPRDHFSAVICSAIWTFFTFKDKRDIISRKLKSQKRRRGHFSFEIFRWGIFSLLDSPQNHRLGVGLIYYPTCWLIHSLQSFVYPQGHRQTLRAVRRQIFMIFMISWKGNKAALFSSIDISMIWSTQVIFYN